MVQTFGNITTPISLAAHELDEYLEKGWFRMGQTIFTCNFLNFKKVFYSAIWLRISLQAYTEESTFKKLQKLNARFVTKIQPATITAEKEELYQKYKTGITFETSSSLTSLLLENGETTIYNTFEVCVYDADKLIATGFFDLGEKSAAGIVSFYDPEYKKHSLGKFLIYNKVAFCKAKNLDYFYPGYFAPNYAMFDYKLNIGKPAIEFLNLKTNLWKNFDTFNPFHITTDEMNYRLLMMEYTLYANKIKFIRLKYEYHNCNCVPHLAGMNLFDYPEFIFVFSPNHNGFNPIIVFDLFTQQYRAVKCISTHFVPDFISTEKYFGTHLMKINEELLVAENPDLFVDLFAVSSLI